MLLKIAIRNLWLHKVRTLAFGVVVLSGTYVAILGNSFVDAITQGMRQSITKSFVGDAQIYAKDAPEKIALFGTPGGNVPDIGFVKDFQSVSEILKTNIPNIQSMLPMGTNIAFVNPENILDRKLGQLRKLEKSRKYPQEREALKAHIRAITSRIRKDFQRNPLNYEFLKSSWNSSQDMKNNLSIAISNSFWKNFDVKYEEKIDFLSNKVAPLIVDENIAIIRFLGTDPNSFQESFPLFQVVKGTKIPKGKRGFLFNDFIYEFMVKNQAARKLDEMKEEIDIEKAQFAKNPALKSQILALKNLDAEIYNQIDPIQTKILIPKLQKLIPSTKKNIRPLIDEFLTLNDKNFQSRYDFFYKEMAPHIILYRFKIGDVIPLTVFSSSGRRRSLNVKFYGTYKFKGFEDSFIASSYSLLDIISFRDLYGFSSSKRRKENEKLNREMQGVTEKDPKDIFAQGDTIPETFESTSDNFLLDPQKIKLMIGATKKQKIFEETYPIEQFQKGPFLNAAIILKDKKKLQETLLKIQKIAKEKKLNIQVATWQEAAGILGQLTIGVRIVLFVVIGIIFLIASFVMMNSLLMTTMERVIEIGTLRAIGAQQSFIAKMIFVETLILNFIFATFGTMCALGTIFYLHITGIPATSKEATFFFSGPRLYLNANIFHIFYICLGILFVSFLATQIPVRWAMKVSPREAMANAR